MLIRELLAALALMAGCPVAAQSHYELHHPDVLHRERGLAALEDGEFGKAMEEFKRSAFFADKGSQAMIAEMYWSGQGVSEDRVLAYIWMDLAAERGYPLMIGKRESFWNALSSAEQQRAVAEGRKVFDEFADHVAKPRLEAILRSGKRQSPGSRVGGSSAFVDVYTEISRTSLRGEAQGTYRPSTMQRDTGIPEATGSTWTWPGPSRLKASSKCCRCRRRTMTRLANQDSKTTRSRSPIID